MLQNHSYQELNSLSAWRQFFPWVSQSEPSQPASWLWPWKHRTETRQDNLDFWPTEQGDEFVLSKLPRPTVICSSSSIWIQCRMAHIPLPQESQSLRKGTPLLGSTSVFCCLHPWAQCLYDRWHFIIPLPHCSMSSLRLFFNASYLEVSPYYLSRNTLLITVIS